MEIRKLGFGAMRLPLLQADDPKSIDLEQVKRMADLFMERGFVYVDTAYPYHGEQSEAAVREAVVRRFPRESFLLADKLPIDADWAGAGGQAQNKGAILLVAADLVGDIIRRPLAHLLIIILNNNAHSEYSLLS